MTLVEAKEIFLNRGYVQVKGGRIYDGDKWRESVAIISKWLEQEPCEDCISREAAIDALGYNISITSDEGLDEYRTVLKEMLVKIYDTQVAQIKALPSIQPTTKENLVVEDCISRNAIIETLNEMDRYIADELTLCDSNNKFPQNEVFIVDDVYEQIAEQLPPVTPKSKTDVLDKIRAEIEQNAYPIVHGVNNHEKGMTLYGILEVIDKYKTESEE